MSGIMPVGDVTAETLKAAIRGLTDRAAAISDNIANVETPGFRARRVDFESSLAAAIENGNPADAGVEVSTSLAATRLNGSNVDLAVEMASMDETQLRLTTVVQAFNAKITRARTVLGR
jgi:flagellar basal-body rod protein FlgB